MNSIIELYYSRRLFLASVSFHPTNMIVCIKKRVDTLYVILVVKDSGTLAASHTVNDLTIHDTTTHTIVEQYQQQNAKCHRKKWCKQEKKKYEKKEKSTKSRAKWQRIVNQSSMFWLLMVSLLLMRRIYFSGSSPNSLTIVLEAKQFMHIELDFLVAIGVRCCCCCRHCRLSVAARVQKYINRMSAWIHTEWFWWCLWQYHNNAQAADNNTVLLISIEYELFIAGSKRRPTNSGSKRWNQMNRLWPNYHRKKYIIIMKVNVCQHSYHTLI